MKIVLASAPVLLMCVSCGGQGIEGKMGEPGARGPQGPAGEAGPPGPTGNVPDSGVATDGSTSQCSTGNTNGIFYFQASGSEFQHAELADPPESSGAVVGTLVDLASNFFPGLSPVAAIAKAIGILPDSTEATETKGIMVNYAAEGAFTFDGAGKWTLDLSLSAQEYLAVGNAGAPGSLIAPPAEISSDTTGSGTYAVKEDCSVVLTGKFDVSGVKSSPEPETVEPYSRTVELRGRVILRSEGLAIQQENGPVWIAYRL